LQNAPKAREPVNYYNAEMANNYKGRYPKKDNGRHYYKGQLIV